MVKKTTLVFLCAISFLLPSSVFSQTEAKAQTFDNFSSFYSNTVLGDTFGVSIAPDMVKEFVPEYIPAPLKMKAGDFSSFPNYSFSYLNNLTVDIINASNKSIDIVMYSIQLKEFPEALIAAHDRGIKVRMILNQFHVYERPSTEIKKLLKSGIEIRTLRGTRDYGVMHNKIGIFDKKLITTGSYNWAFSSTFHNHENMLLTQHPIYVKGYTNYWKWMWKNASTLEEGAQESVPMGHYGTPPQDENPVMEFNGLPVPSYIFSPGSQSEERLAELIGAAEKTVDAVTFTFSSRILADALIAAKDRGVKVRFMTDRDMGKSSWAAKLIYNNGVEMKWRKGRTTRGAMHNKYVILDGEMLQTGSFNWSINGNVNSFENMIFIN
ncbi:MAG: phospholipase D-like domain-containing protein, partial [Elusimicrobiota bacterium]|nr:phospholipase D-like domain-containing protein [Elusimicrobiota bacterium]